jgi:hypothetical protein
MMILSQVWQRLLLLSLQPMAWIMIAPSPEAEPRPVKRRGVRGRARARRR